MNRYEQINQLGRQLQQKFELIAAAKTLRFIGGNFAAQGYQGATFKKWASRKSSKKRNIGRALLVQTGKLKRGWNSRTTAPGEVQIYNDVPYAEIHNNGGTIHQAARSETFKRNRHTESITYKRGKNAGKYKQVKGQFAKGTTQGQGFTFKERNITIPRRQMIPTDDSDSPILRAAIERELRNELQELENLLNH